MIITAEYYEQYKHSFNKKLKTILMGIGFDYGLKGTHYLHELLLRILLEPRKIHNLSSKVMTELVDIGDCSVKCIDKNIRWAINKAYENGRASIKMPIKNAIKNCDVLDFSLHIMPSKQYFIINILLAGAGILYSKKNRRKDNLSVDVQTIMQFQ